jgi:hypothetical protein
MAILLSEDQDVVSKLNLSAGEMKVLSGEHAENQQWQAVTLQLSSGTRQIRTAAADDVLLCRTPTDEPQDFIEQLEELAASIRQEVYFEPSEPSFELTLIRTRRGGIKVEAWIDSGNGSTGIYTWDACGIRFYTTDENIRTFIDELKREFGI